MLKFFRQKKNKTRWKFGCAQKNKEYVNGKDMDKIKHLLLKISLKDNCLFKAKIKIMYIVEFIT